jgi:hypothetical protein
MFLAVTTRLALPCLATVQSATTAYPPAVYTRGCTPPPKPTGKTWYVDPVHGTTSGDGTAAHPWHTFAEVVSAGLISSPSFIARGGSYKAGKLATLNPDGTIKAGDLIYLMNGNHGCIKLTGYRNTGFITVQAYPGQTPVIGELAMTGCTNWVFRGITFQNTTDNGTASGGGTLIGGFGSQLVEVGGDTYWAGPGYNAWFENNVIQSAPNVDKWTAADWVAHAATQGMLVRNTSSNTTLLNNTFRNIRFGLGLYGPTNVLVYGNTIDNFADDGIDYNGSHVTIQKNTITNHVYIGNAGDGFHWDGMQGQLFPGVNQDWIIDSNVVIMKTRPLTLDDPNNNYLQGIDEFDGLWQDVTVTNNLVITQNVWHGIAFYGVNNCKIINNTVIDANAPGSKYYTWIGIFQAKAAYGAQKPINNVVRNNVAMYMAPGSFPTTVADHNIVAKYGTATDPSKLYVADDPSAYRYNAHPLPNGPLVGAGSPTLAPPYDIDGFKRVPPITVGAYDVVRSGVTSANGK